jgi:hypothetical protein
MRPIPRHRLHRECTMVASAQAGHLRNDPALLHVTARQDECGEPARMVMGSTIEIWLEYSGKVNSKPGRQNNPQPIEKYLSVNLDLILTHEIPAIRFTTANSQFHFVTSLNPTPGPAISAGSGMAWAAAGLAGKLRWPDWRRKSLTLIAHLYFRLISLPVASGWL